MVTSDNSYLGYNTYILGTSRNVIDCLRIIVYNRSKLLSTGKVSKVSIYNLNGVINQLKSLGKDYYTEIPRATINDYFKYDERGDGFDTIIYLSNSDNSGIGYTEFITSQGEYRDINIYILFNSKINLGVDIKIVNSLSQLQNNSTVERDWIGDNLYDYVSMTEVKGWKGRPNQSLYSSHVESLMGPRQSGILVGNGIITSLQGNDPSLYSLKISKNISVDPYGNEFSKSCIGYYSEGDTAYYSWDGLKYSIYSLCNVNRFGNPTNYTPGGSSGYFTIPGLHQDDKILYFSGRIAVVCREGKTEFYDTVTQEFISLRSGSGNYFIDTYDPSSMLIELPKIPYYNNVISYVPEVLNTFFDIKTFSLNNYLNIVRRYGDWFVFSEQKKKTLSSYSIIYIFSSLTSSIRVTEEEIDNVYLFNNNILGLKTEDGGMIVYNSPRNNWYSPKALQLSYPEEGDIKEEYLKKQEKAKEEGKIIEIPSDKPIWNTWLKKFKRNGISFYNGEFPRVKDIVGTWSGLVFYKLNGYLNYL